MLLKAISIIATESHRIPGNSETIFVDINTRSK